MTSRRSRSHRARRVWGIFALAIAVVTGVLALSRQAKDRPGFLLTNVETMGAPAQSDAINRSLEGIDRQRWSSIVIHHSGSPTGDPETLTREHLSMGLKGLGYHFVIGNGGRLGDGVVHVGYRWIDQLPGAHVSGPQQEEFNEHSIGICLIGNGDRRPFTDRQMTQLVNLVQRVQAELRIPARNVYLHRDLSPVTTSPGRFFPTAWLQGQLVERQ